MMNKRLLIVTTMCLVCLTLCGQTDKPTLRLFSEDMKTAYPSVVYDFLERYLYDIHHTTYGYELRQRMADDKVGVTEGSLDNIPKLSPGIPFSLLRHENTCYNVCWTDTLGHTLLALQFPINFELLLGQPKAEIEKEMKNLLSSYSDVANPQPLTSELDTLSDGCFRTKPITHFYVDGLNTATYYTKAKDGTVQPVFDKKQKWYSASNLFHGLISETADYRLYIEQTLYGFNKQSYTIPLNQWLNYCKENKLIIYFAIEEEREDGLKALLIAQSQDLGFNHMLSIIIPDNFVEKRNSTLKATLNAYIPTDNVKDLYQQYKEKPKKKI